MNLFIFIKCICLCIFIYIFIHVIFLFSVYCYFFVLCLKCFSLNCPWTIWIENPCIKARDVLGSLLNQGHGKYWEILTFMSLFQFNFNYSTCHTGNIVCHKKHWIKLETNKGYISDTSQNLTSFFSQRHLISQRNFIRKVHAVLPLLRSHFTGIARETR